MENIDDLTDVFHSLVSLASGVNTERVILADQGRAPPAGTELYVTYKPVPVRAYGQPGRKLEHIAPVEDVDESLGDDWTDLQETVASSMEFMLSVNFLNEGADMAAMMMQNANFRTPVSEYLFRNHIAWRYASSARNLTGLMQAGIQPRWQTDIHLFIEHEVSYSVLRAAGFTVFVSTN